MPGRPKVFPDGRTINSFAAGKRMSGLFVTHTYRRALFDIRAHLGTPGTQESGTNNRRSTGYDHADARGDLAVGDHWPSGVLAGHARRTRAALEQPGVIDRTDRLVNRLRDPWPVNRFDGLRAVGDEIAQCPLMHATEPRGQRMTKH